MGVLVATGARAAGRVIGDDAAQLPPSFGFQKVYELQVPFGDIKFPEPVNEFTNPQIPATGEIAMLVVRDFFVVSNSGPLVKDIVLTHYGTTTGRRSVRDIPEYEELERELAGNLSGLIWLHGENLQPVIDDYLAFADADNARPNPEWMMQVRRRPKTTCARSSIPATRASRACRPT